MRLLDISYDDPAMNLALDEAILDSAERGLAGETLRFWESPIPFVVLGVAQKIAEEVHQNACAQDDVSVLRRCSAGGCVLQGPGSLNYSLVLSYDRAPELRNIRDSYCHILNRICRAFAPKGIAAAISGVSDLTMGGLKFSGNAQKRRKAFFLHHGTLLHNVNHDLLARYLKEPGDRPDYRGERNHADFVTSLPLSPGGLREVVLCAFPTDQAPSAPLQADLACAEDLVEKKYRLESWTCRR